MLAQISLEQLDQARDAMQDAAAQLAPSAMLVLAVIFALGLVIWLMGGKLARGACVLSGLGLGGLAGSAIGAALADEGALVLPLVIGGALAGALLAGFLFRIWTTISGAVVFALALPAGVLLWNGSPGPAALTPDQVNEQVRATIGSVIDQADPTDTGDGDGGSQGDETDQARGVYTQLAGGIGRLVQAQIAEFRLWWDGIGSSVRQTTLGSAAVGIVLGIVLGLMIPHTSAMLQAAIIGSSIMFFAGRGLIEGIFGESTGWLPHSPRGVVVAIGLITIVRLALNWTARRRLADKRH